MERLHERGLLLRQKVGEAKDRLFPTKVKSLEMFVQLSQARGVRQVYVATETKRFFDYGAAYNGPLDSGMGRSFLSAEQRTPPFFVKTEVQTIDTSPGRKVIYTREHGGRTQMPELGSDEYLREVKSSQSVQQRLCEQLPGVEIEVVLPEGQNFAELVAEADRRGLQPYS